MDSASKLQHPRRNLGSRHRAQADRFVKLSKKDSERAAENLAWAEQNAQQAVLYDFTDERNWRCLAEIKKMRMDGEGLALVLEDLFIVLGRDPNQLSQIRGVNHLEVGLELLEAAFITDSLEPETWFERLDEKGLEDFVVRCRGLDFTDQRANIVYGRRLERIRGAGHEEMFIVLVHHLLAHRPANHELWMELGRLHERRNEIDQAWLCYDHVQQIRPTEPVRDLFLDRLKRAMDGEESVPWSGPSLQTRSDFLDRMQNLSQNVSNVPIEELSVPEEIVNNELTRLENLLQAGEAAEAFFLARSLFTSGEEWAQEWMERAQSML
jgi:tetratricopeptide (TPR) repeat protein